MESKKKEKRKKKERKKKKKKSKKIKENDLESKEFEEKNVTAIGHFGLEVQMRKHVGNKRSRSPKMLFGVQRVMLLLSR